MHSLARLVPPCASTYRISARPWAVLAASLACASVVFAGLYPQFDGGKYRLVLTATTGLLAALLVWVSLLPKSRGLAVLAALGLSAAFGSMNTILPAVLLTRGDRPSELGFALVYGVVFGVPTGLAYGGPLAVLIGFLHGPIQSSSLDATDRVKLRAALGSVAITLLGVAVAWEIAPERPIWSVPATLGVVGLGLALYHARRIRLRRAWTARVRAGKEPMLRVRELSPADPPELPRFGDGLSVVVVEVLPSTSAEGVYRVPGAGVALAVVSDADMFPT